MNNANNTYCEQCNNQKKHFKPAVPNLLLAYQSEKPEKTVSKPAGIREQAGGFAAFREAVYGDALRGGGQRAADCGRKEALGNCRL